MLLPVIQTLSTKGQLVIPKKFRHALGIKAGTKIALKLDSKAKTVELKPAPHDPIAAATGILQKYVKPGHTFNDILKEKYAEIARGE